MSIGSKRVLLGILLTTSMTSSAPAVEPSACTILSGELPSCHEGAEVEIRNCWQRTIVATRALSPNAYRTMKLRVTFTHSATGRTKVRYAFYDGTHDGTPTGRDVIRVRTSLSDLGTWTYSFACEAGDCLTGSGLTNAEIPNRSLTVTSLQTPSSNPLFTKGHPGIYRSIPEMAGTILYENSERFYWLADSAWAAPLRALPNEWKSYIDDRKSRGFTVVQIGIAPEWAGGCIESQPNSGRRPPFSDQPSGSACAAPVNGISEPPGSEAPTEIPALQSTNYPTGDSLPHPTFWNRYERMIQYANCQGLTVLVAGVMEPVSRYPTLENLKPFARNLAARLSGNAVILSPGFDTGVAAECNSNPVLAGPDLLIREVGKELALTAPQLLTTNHFGTMAGQAAGNSSAYTLDRICTYRSFTTDPWMDLWIGQTGQNGNRLDRITERPRTLMSGLRGITDTRFASSRRPVVNGEAIYDHGQNPQDVNPLHTNRFRARQANWLSWLSGAVGYSFGTMGVWDWGICGDNPPPPVPPIPPAPPGTTGTTPRFCTTDPWMVHTSQHNAYGTAMARPSSADMTQFKSLLINWTQWWKLVVTEQSRIQNQPLEPVPGFPGTYRPAQDKLMVVARDYNWIVAYLPHNDSIVLDVSNLPFCTSTAVPPTCRATFFSPRSGAAEMSIDSLGVQVPGQPRRFTFSNPNGLGGIGDDDWVLGISRTASASLGWSAGNSNRLEARPAKVDISGTMALVGHLVDATGVELTAEIEVSDRTKSVPFAARAARDGTGRFVLAWQENGPGGDGSQVWLRRLDAAGNPTGTQFPPSTDTARRQSLSVASDSAGRFVAVWEEWNQETERFEVQARSFQANGTPLTGSLPLATAPSGQLDAMPLVACDPNGACVAAWERRAAGDERTALWLASFSLASPWSISAYEYKPASGETLSVELLVAKAAGDFEFSFERLDGGSKSLGVTGTRLNASALPVGTEYSVRGPWEEQ